MALVVNGEGIAVAEFDSEVSRYIAAQQALGKTVASMDATKAVLDDLTSRLLLAQGARGNGFVLDDAALQARIDSLAAQIGGAENLSMWLSNHGKKTYKKAIGGLYKKRLIAIEGDGIRLIAKP